MTVLALNALEPELHWYIALDRRIVAGKAWCNHMRPRQFKPCFTVVPRYVVVDGQPFFLRVAALALCPSGRLLEDAVVIVDVTGHAGLRDWCGVNVLQAGDQVFQFDTITGGLTRIMTRSTGHRRMRFHQ